MLSLDLFVVGLLASTFSLGLAVVAALTFRGDQNSSIFTLMENSVTIVLWSGYLLFWLSLPLIAIEMLIRYF